MIKKTSKNKILVGLSGGVDSAVAAYLLREAGYEVECGFMINYISDTADCPTMADMEEARKVAEYLGLPFHTFDFREEYEKRIVNYIYEGYKKGLTPNPDILCNNLVKFDCFLQEAIEYGFDRIATGHYARIISAPLTRGDGGGLGFNISYKQKDIDTILPPGQGGIEGGYIPYDHNLTKFAQENRKNPTPFEKKFWYKILKTPELNKYKFTQQKPLLSYIVDFYCAELRLVIEIDGNSHSKQIEYDIKRAQNLGNFGISILRYTNQNVLKNIEGVYDDMLTYIKNNLPMPPLSGGKDFTVSNLQSPTPVFHLLKGVDPKKDQSYFLSRLSQSQLSHTLFPIGHLEKSKVREIARKARFPNAERKDSQGLCFIGKVNMKEFLEKRIEKKPGNIINTTGKILGQHEGAFSYTIGQRRGIEIGGGPALFVIKKDVKNNTITVGTKAELELYSSELTAVDWHWIGNPRTFPFNAQAKIRYRQEDQDGECTKLDDDHIKISFKSSQRAITSGQMIVIYDGDELIGSGVIE